MSTDLKTKHNSALEEYAEVIRDAKKIIKEADKRRKFLQEELLKDLGEHNRASGTRKEELFILQYVSTFIEIQLAAAERQYNVHKLVKELPDRTILDESDFLMFDFIDIKNRCETFLNIQKAFHNSQTFNPT